MRIFIRALVLCQVLAFLWVGYAGHQADLAMDKSGLGDLESWRHWNYLAGLGFLFGAVAWFSAVIGVGVAKWKNKGFIFTKTEGKWGLLAAMFIFPPFLFVFGQLFLAVVLL